MAKKKAKKKAASKRTSRSAKPKAKKAKQTKKKRAAAGDGFEAIKQAIADAARAAFTGVMQKRPNDQFFAFALSTLDDAGDVGVSVNSEQNHQKLLTKKKIATPSPDEEYQRWNPCEWGPLEYVGARLFDPVAKLLAAKYDEMAENRFAAYRAGVLDAMQGALALLDSEKLWGTGAKRKEVTLFVTVYDSESAAKVEDKSAKALNPAPTYTRFKKRYAETERAKREEKKQRQASRAEVASLSTARQAQYWIDALLELASNPPADPIEEMNAEDAIMESLTKLGQPAVMPILDFIETSMTNDTKSADSLRASVLKTIANNSKSTPKIHDKLAALLEQYCQHNQGRKLWQITPFHLAKCIYKLFDGYPMPGMEGHSALRDYQKFIDLTKQ